ncbi:MAG: AMP-binding protein, partial [Alphaproteobacteria bacterium]
MAKLWAGLRDRITVLLAFFRERPAPAEVLERPWEKSYPEGVRWDAEIPARPVPALLDEAIAKWPDNPCLEFLGRRYSYAEVGELVAKAAKGFQGLGVTKGVKVGLFLPNTPYYVICYHAILKAGGTVVNFNPLYAEPGIARQIQDSDTRIMVTMNLNTLYPKIAQRLEDTCLEKIVICRMSKALAFPKRALFILFKRRELTVPIPDDAAHIRFGKLIDNDGVPAAVDIDPEHDVAVMQYTGGTTGIPKGAMLTHANLYANTVQTRIWAPGFNPGKEKLLAVLPLFHVFGMTAVMNVG